MRRILTIPLVVGLLGLAVLVLPIAQSVQAADEQCFPQTGQCLSGRFLDYWRQNGGLAVFGYPISPARPEVNRDTGQTYLTQWFERNRFELHPEQARPYDVLLGRLGDDLLQRRGLSGQSREDGPLPGCLWFPQTGHNVCDEPGGFQFKSYWERHGLADPRLSASDRSLALFGYPLTDVQWETNRSGYRVLTQWFERARFEWHPDRPTQPTRVTVLLGLLGHEVHTPPEPLLPGDLERARTALTGYFAALQAGRYQEAVQVYGGSYEALCEWNPEVAADDYAALFAGGCRFNGLQCLLVRRIVGEAAPSAREFQFVVEFATPDGQLFRRGPCCGASEAEMPTRTQFPYTVTKIGQQFVVHELPVYVP